MEKKLSKYLDQLKAFNNERRAWLFLSGFVVTVILAIVIEWKDIVEYKLIWSIMSIGFTICAVWWYWTMRLIRYILESKHEEYQLLSDIVDLVQYVKEDVKKLKG